MAKPPLLICRKKQAKVHNRPIAERKSESLCHVLTQGDLLASASEDSDFNEDERDISDEIVNSDNCVGEVNDQGPSNHNKDSDDMSCVDLFSSDDSDYEYDFSDQEDDLDDDHFGMEATVNSLLEMFLNFLTSPDSCNHDPEAAKECKDRVLTILKAVDSSLNLQSLVDRKGIRDLFLKNYCTRKGLHPKTIQAYLTSLEHFYNFVLSKNLTGFDKDDILSMQNRVKTWKKGYTPQVKIANMAKMENERRTRIMPSQILGFEASPAVWNIVKLLGFISAGRKLEITQSRFNDVRNLIFIQVFINNGHRAGALANMTIEELENKEKTKNGYRITVFKHK